MPIQHQRLIPRYTMWRLLEDGVLAEECLWNNTVGSGTVSFSGVVETFFSPQKTRNDGFSSMLPTASFHDSGAARLCSSTRGRSVPASPHAYEFLGWYSTSKEKSWAPSPLPPNWVEGSFPSQAGELPPSAVRSERAVVHLCSSSSHAVGAGPFLTPGQLFWWNRGKQCGSGNGNDLSIVASRGIWMLAAGRSKERLKRT